MTDLTLQTMFKAYKDNESDILTYIEKKRYIVEEYKFDSDTDVEINTDNLMKLGAFSGVAIGLFILLFLVIMVLSIWAVYALIKYSKVMPTWAIVLGCLFFLFTGPIMPLILVYATKNTK